MTDDYASDIPLELAVRAHSGTSMVPDVRGDEERRAYASTLAHDLEDLGKLADTDEKRAYLLEAFPIYRDAYRLATQAQLSAKGRCLSSMITGPSNFNTRRAQKASDSADKRSQELIECRVRWLKIIRRKLRPEAGPIMSGDSDAVSRLKVQIAKQEELLQRMRESNKVIRKLAKAGGPAQIAGLVGLGFGADTAAKILEPDAFGRIGFPPYMLTNNGANLRRLQARLVVVEAAKGQPDTAAEGTAAKLEDSPTDNRVRLYFPGKPDAEVRAQLKASGFRWAPTSGAWQAYRNDRSLETARAIAGVA